MPAAALLGGAAMYLLAHVAFRLRNMHSLSVRRLVCAPCCSRSCPPARRCRRSLTLGLLAALLALLIAYEALRYADVRERVRHAGSPAPPVTD